MNPANVAIFPLPNSDTAAPENMGDSGCVGLLPDGEADPSPLPLPLPPEPEPDPEPPDPDPDPEPDPPDPPDPEPPEPEPPAVPLPDSPGPVGRMAGAVFEASAAVLVALLKGAVEETTLCGTPVGTVTTLAAPPQMPNANSAYSVVMLVS